MIDVLWDLKTPTLLFEINWPSISSQIFLFTNYSHAAHFWWFFFEMNHREGSSCLKICWGPNDFLMDLVLNNLDDVALMIFAKNLWIWKEAMSKSYHFFAYDHKQDWLPWAKIALWVKFEMNRRKCLFFVVFTCM